MSNNDTRMKEFLVDLVPFFYGRPVTYVDIGAYEGKVFQDVVACGLKVREAHLFEPNELSLSTARENATAIFKGNNLNFYRVALGRARKKVRMRSARNMTKVVKDRSRKRASAAQGSSFEVECTTLDEMIDSITERHISLLKIDVEGSELDVLAGARKVLRGQCVDVMYIEAGLNPAGKQQCYYRDIEDVLRRYGYSVFKIYEQQHEWMEDSPRLRRVNLAFMSEKFAAANPYRVTQELYQAQQQIVGLKSEAGNAQVRASKVETEAQTLHGQFATLAQQHRTVVGERDEIKELLTTAKRSQALLSDKLSSSETQWASAARETDNLKTLLETAEASNNSLSENLTASEQRCQAAVKKVTDLRSRITAVEQASTSLSDRLASSERQRLETAEDIERLRTLRVAAEASERSLSGKLAASEHECKAALEQGSALRALLTTGEESRRSLANKLADSEMQRLSIVEGSDRLKALLATAEASQRSLSDKATALEQQYRMAVESGLKLQALLTTADESYRSTLSERETFRTLLASAERKQHTSAEKLAASERALAALRAEVTSLQGSLQHAERTTCALLAERDSVTERLVALQHDNSDLQSTLVTVNQQLIASDGDNGRLRELLGNTEQSHVRMLEARDAARHECELSDRRVAELTTECARLTRDRDDLRIAHSESLRTSAAHREDLETARERAEFLESMVTEVFAGMAELHGRERRFWKEAVSARTDHEETRSGQAYLLGTRMLDFVNSGLGWAKAPFALWQEYVRLRNLEPSNLANSRDTTPLTIKLGSSKASVVLPLAVKPQIVQLAPAHVGQQVWGRILTNDPGASVNVDLTVRTRGGSPDVREPILQKKVRLHAGVPCRLLDVTNEKTEIDVRRAAGQFSLLTLELRSVSLAPGEGENKGKATDTKPTYVSPTAHRKHQSTFSPPSSVKGRAPDGHVMSVAGSPQNVGAGATPRQVVAAKSTAITAERVLERPRVAPLGLSYEAKTKPVPERPAELPADLVLPALRGIANDYSFIESACRQRWAGGRCDYTMPVSVVIPVYNRSRELDFVLAGLLHQTYPRELMEVVIADDGSREDLALIYRKYEDRLSIRYCRQDDLGYRLAEVRNLGIATASHDSIIILDGDAIPSPRLIEEYMQRFHVERNVAMFGLRHYVSVADVDVDAFAADARFIHDAPRVLSENRVATQAREGDTHSTDWRETPIRNTDLLKSEALPYRFLVGANCGFSREVFDKVGGYSDAFRAWGFEDQEFGYRLCREGAYFIPLMDAYVYHQEPLNGKNDTDRKLGAAVTRDIFIQKCPFIYRTRSTQKAPFEVPLVSIYVPLFNRERYIVECIESALNQTVRDLEVVVCDDGSTDRSTDLVEQHFRHDRRVRLIKQKNGGIGAASNTAVRAARGFYIGQLDADDVLKRDAVEQCLGVMEKNPRLALVYGTTEYIDEDSAVLQEGWNWPHFTREHLITRMICHHFRFFRKRDWARTQGFNERIRNAVDYDMMLKLAEVGEVVHLNRVLYQYRKHAATTTSQENETQTTNNFVVINDSLRRMGITRYTAVADARLGVERTVKFVTAES